MWPPRRLLIGVGDNDSQQTQYLPKPPRCGDPGARASGSSGTSRAANCWSWGSARAGSSGALRSGIAGARATPGCTPSRRRARTRRRSRRAAVLAGGPDRAWPATPRPRTCGGFWRRWQPPPEITLTAGDRRPRGILTHRCPSLKRPDITRQLGVPVTSPARTILDLAPRAQHARQLTRLVNDARRRRLPARRQRSLDVVARNPYHPGTKLLRPVRRDRRQPHRSPFRGRLPAPSSGSTACRPRRSTSSSTAARSTPSSRSTT